MSAIRTIAVSASALFLGLSGMFVVTGTALAANSMYSIECDEDWHTPIPTPCP
jgi:hypothetical protein